jgi:pimeloyl-ACP methyl ester carboxylesterase
MTTPPHVAHGQVRLALLELRAAGGPRVLLLHALGESSASWHEDAVAWPGTAVALDFAGHGTSSWRPGGAYTAELFAADVDAALAALGPCALAGKGLGAYVALLVAGARPQLAPAALLLPGAGLAGLGPAPEPERVPDLVGSLGALDRTPAQRGIGTDPATRACDADVRPPDYARAFGAAARRLVLLEDGGGRPPWWEALRTLPSVRSVRGDTAEALRALAEDAGTAAPAGGARSTS